MKITAITIDFWGTLLFDGPGSDERYRRRRLADFKRILDEAGATVAPDVLERAYERSATYLGQIWSRCRDVPVTDHVGAIVRAADPELARGLPGSVIDRLVEAYSTPALMVPPAVDDTARQALDTLAARGYVLAVVSNTMRTPGVTLRKLLERYELLPYFKHTTFSDEVGVRKPDPAIFALTLHALGAAPGATVHVGDDHRLDVEGARAAGLRVVQVGGRPGPAGGVAPDAVIARLGELPETIEALQRG